MWTNWVIARETNIVRVDFSRSPEPPNPRFPGASGVRELRQNIFELQLKLPEVRCRAA
jgi:hypothetical protein